MIIKTKNQKKNHFHSFFEIPMMALQRKTAAQIHIPDPWRRSLHCAHEASRKHPSA